MKGQLTGIPRQIKDSVADIYNNVQKWKKLNAEGFEQLTKVCDLKLELFVPLDSKMRESLTQCHRYSETLDLPCQKLVCILERIKLLTDEFVMLADKFNKLTELASFNSTLGNSADDVPFSGWPVSQFARYAQEIAEMFTKEYFVKHCIVESVAHVDCNRESEDVASLSEECRDILMTYSSCWLHQPYINEKSLDILIEGLLFETGHSS